MQKRSRFILECSTKTYLLVIILWSCIHKIECRNNQCLRVNTFRSKASKHPDMCSEQYQSSCSLSEWRSTSYCFCLTYTNTNTRKLYSTWQRSYYIFICISKVITSNWWLIINHILQFSINSKNLLPWQELILFNMFPSYQLNW